MIARPSRLPRVLIGVAAALTLVALIGVSHRRAAALRATLPPEKDLVYLPGVSALRIASLGHVELAADLVFMKAVLYFGTQLAGARDYSWFDQHLDTVIALSPRFRTPYLFGTRATMYNGLTIDNAAVQRSSHFAEAGLRQFPDDWELAFTLGCNYLFELSTQDPKQRSEWQRTGAEWIRRASLVGGGPEWLPGLAARVMTDEGLMDAEIQYLTEVYLNAPTPAAADEAHRLLLAKSARNVASLEAARTAFEAAFARRLPYGTPALFVLIGVPPSPRLDLAFLTRDEVLEAEEREAQAARAR